jgi:hypothetical protein
MIGSYAFGMIRTNFSTCSTELDILGFEPSVMKWIVDDDGLDRKLPVAQLVERKTVIGRLPS